MQANIKQYLENLSKRESKIKSLEKEKESTNKRMAEAVKKARNRAKADMDSAIAEARSRHRNDLRALTRFLETIRYLTKPIPNRVARFINDGVGDATGVGADIIRLTTTPKVVVPIISTTIAPPVPIIRPTATSSTRVNPDDDFLDLPWGRPDDNYWDNLSPLEMKHYYKFFKKKYVISSNN